MCRTLWHQRRLRWCFATHSRPSACLHLHDQPHKNEQWPPTWRCVCDSGVRAGVSKTDSVAEPSGYCNIFAHFWAAKNVVLAIHCTRGYFMAFRVALLSSHLQANAIEYKVNRIENMKINAKRESWFYVSSNKLLLIYWRFDSTFSARVHQLQTRLSLGCTCGSGIHLVSEFISLPQPKLMPILQIAATEEVSSRG